MIKPSAIGTPFVVFRDGAPAPSAWTRVLRPCRRGQRPLVAAPPSRPEDRSIGTCGPAVDRTESLRSSHGPGADPQAGRQEAVHGRGKAGGRSGMSSYGL